MKTANKFRATNTFSIVGGEVQDLAKIAGHFGTKLVSVARDKNDQIGVYVVRALCDEGLVDSLVRTTYGEVEVLIQTTIIQRKAS
jgi:hypothetical protein